MFYDLQQSLIDVLEAKRQAATVQPGRLIPAAVLPYGGELLAPKQLIHATPVLYVRGVDSAALEVADSQGLLVTGTVTPDVLCVAQNQAGGAAQEGDMAALLSWTFEALLGAQITAGGYLFAIDRFTVSTLLAHSPINVMALSPVLQTMN